MEAGGAFFYWSGGVAAIEDAVVIECRALRGYVAMIAAYKEIDRMGPGQMPAL